MEVPSPYLALMERRSSENAVADIFAYRFRADAKPLHSSYVKKKCRCSQPPMPSAVKKASRDPISFESLSMVCFIKGLVVARPTTFSSLSTIGM